MSFDIRFDQEKKILIVTVGDTFTSRRVSNRDGFVDNAIRAISS